MQIIQSTNNTLNNITFENQDLQPNIHITILYTTILISSIQHN